MKVTVKQNPDKVVPVEIIAECIVNISEGTKKLRSGPLTDKALLILISHSAPAKPSKYGNGTSGARYSTKVIKDILDGLEDLEKTFLKKKG